MKEFTQDQLLLREVQATFEQFVWAPNKHCHTVTTLWVAHTHLRKSLASGGEFLPYITPRLYFGSKIAGCGKSLALKVTTRLSHNGEMILSPTTAGIITMINEDRATLGFDEIDTFFGRNGSGRDTMRAVLNGGYEHGTRIPRQAQYASDKQNIHGPIAMAGKNAAAFTGSDGFETLRTRSISIILDRKPADAYVDQFDPELHNSRLRGLMERLKDWGVANAKEITGIDVGEIIPKEIINRDREIWTVLFRIAQFVGDEWPERVERAARAFVLGEWDKDDTPCVSPAKELLTCVRAAFEDGEEFLPTAEILFRIREPGPLRPSLADEWTSVRSAEMGLASGLGVHGIESVRPMIDGVQAKGYTRFDLGIPVPVDLQT